MLNIKQYIINNEIVISKSEWAALNNQYSKDTIKKALSDAIEEYVLPLPYRKVTEEEARKDFLYLSLLDTKELMCPGSSFSRYDYIIPAAKKYIKSNRTGLLASDYFHQQSRFLCDSLNAPSPHRVWNIKKFRLTYLDSLWSMKVNHINNSVLLECLKLRKFIASQFKPAAAKTIYELFESKRVLDFSSGWGDRLCAFYSCKNTEFYMGIDPNKNLFDVYESQISFYNKPDKKIVMINAPAEDFDFPTNEFDTVFTSPPYFIIERYTQQPNQSWQRYKILEEWLDNFLFSVADKSIHALKQGGSLAINISDVYARHTINKLVDPLYNYINSRKDMEYIETIGMQLSKRLSNSKSNKSGIFVEPILIWKKK
jgi:tRNA1(Val) A37 N6-methylase TrmN6